MSAALEAALGTIRDWPVDSASAAVVGPGGTLATYGAQDHAYALASVTKPLAALCILVAVEEGAVDLGDPADEDLVPGATLRHLLAHASGLAPERPLRAFAPGVRRVYSNVGIERAADLVAAGAQMSFASYAEQSLLAALSLRDTTLAGSPARDGRSTARDLARVVAELLSPSVLLHPATLAEATTVQYPGLRGVLPGFGPQERNDWGLGFEIRADKRPHWTGSANSPATYGHFGQSGTFVWVDPAVRTGLVVLTDRDFGPWAVDAWPRLSDAVLAAI